MIAEVLQNDPHDALAERRFLSPLKNVPKTRCSIVSECNQAVSIEYSRRHPLLQEESGAVLLTGDLAEFDLEPGRQA